LIEAGWARSASWLPPRRLDRAIGLKQDFARSRGWWDAGTGTSAGRCLGVFSEWALATRFPTLWHDVISHADPGV
jgi:hypothetical protein